MRALRARLVKCEWVRFDGWKARGLHIITYTFPVTQRCHYLSKTRILRAYQYTAYLTRIHFSNFNHDFCFLFFFCRRSFLLLSFQRLTNDDDIYHFMSSTFCQQTTPKISKRTNFKSSNFIGVNWTQFIDFGIMKFRQNSYHFKQPMRKQLLLLWLHLLRIVTVKINKSIMACCNDPFVLFCLAVGWHNLSEHSVIVRMSEVEFSDEPDWQRNFWWSSKRLLMTKIGSFGWKFYFGHSNLENRPNAGISDKGGSFRLSASDWNLVLAKSHDVRIGHSNEKKDQNTELKSRRNVSKYTIKNFDFVSNWHKMRTWLTTSWRHFHKTLNQASFFLSRTRTFNIIRSFYSLFVLLVLFSLNHCLMKF